jgi:septum formation protein
VRPADVAEVEEGDPVAAARENALRKALAIATPAAPLVLGVDTVVSLDGTIHGKPADEAHAARTLRTLAGHTHQVVSALALVREGEPRTATAVTDVTFRALDDARIAWYVSTGEWRERAGGYAIQGRGAALVREISGDYLNVVGLPAAALLDLLGW